jgi:hypothetical protein
VLTAWHVLNTAANDANAELPDNSAWWIVVPEEATFTAGPRRMSPTLRDAYWDVLRDAGRDNLKIPRVLEWSSSPRTREYLNATETGLDLEYFVPVYADTRAYRRVTKRTAARQSSRVH